MVDDRRDYLIVHTPERRVRVHGNIPDKIEISEWKEGKRVEISIPKHEAAEFCRSLDILIRESPPNGRIEIYTIQGSIWLTPKKVLLLRQRIEILIGNFISKSISISRNRIRVGA